MNGERRSHTHTEQYFSTMRMKESLPFVTTEMDLEGIVLSEIIQIDGQILYDINCMWNLKKPNLQK